MAPLDENKASAKQEAVATGPARRARRPWLGLLGFGLIAVVLALGIYFEIRDRGTAEAGLAQSTEESAVETVNTVSPDAGAPTEEIVLPGNTQPYTDTPIYARTSGYLKSWRFDIGAHVKQGDLLAEIDTPETDAQLL